MKSCKNIIRIPSKTNLIRTPTNMNQTLENAERVLPDAFEYAHLQTKLQRNKLMENELKNFIICQPN